VDIPLKEVNSISPPTVKMIAYAEHLALKGNAKLPAGYDEHFDVCRQFIENNSPRRLDDHARQELRGIAPEIVRSVLGEPNQNLSQKGQLRWGRKGSFALNVDGAQKGLWFDHETRTGGDIINFIAVQHGCSTAEAIRIALGFIGAQVGMLPTCHRELVAGVDDAVRIAQALAIWHSGVLLRDSLGEAYLRQRGIEVPDAAHEVLRFHPSCPFRRTRAPALLGLIQDIVTGEPLGIHRRELTADAGAAGAPMSLGPKSGGAVRLSGEVAGAELTIGEGVETCLAAVMLGFGPVWSVVDASGISGFPVLDHVRRLTILVDHDLSGTGQRVAAECRERWLAAGKPVRRVMPETPGHDVNDLLLAHGRQRGGALNSAPSSETLP
jgi:putative DNA primase/helicase